MTTASKNFKEKYMKQNQKRERMKNKKILRILAAKGIIKEGESNYKKRHLEEALGPSKRRRESKESLERSLLQREVLRLE